MLIKHKQEAEAMKTSERGFSAVEAIVIVVIIGLVGGAGYVAYHRHHTQGNMASTTSSSTQKVTTQPGTTANIDQLTQQDMNDEASVDSKYTSAYQSAAQSSNQAAANVGGAYNESNF
jgi:Tfp pilus assembly protein PilE